MRSGRFGSHEERWHPQAFGPFGLSLAFSPEIEGESRSVWIGDREGADGHVCEGCGTVVLLEPHRPDVPEDWECPACGEMVPGRFDTCWRCQQRRPGSTW